MNSSRLTFLDQVESRYDRQNLIPWWDQGKLSQAKALVAGAGALGNEVLKLLALMGFGHVLVVDFDTVSRSNLARMVLFREQDVGRPKVVVAAERLYEINPGISVRAVEGDLRFDIGLGEFRDADVIFGCLDSVNARWALNRRCFLAGREWIDGGISDFHGAIALHSPGAGACYECTFTPRTLERFNRRYSCPYGLLSSQAADKVPTTAVTTSIIAAFQVQQALLRLHGLDGGLNPGERVTIYVNPFRMTQDRLPSNPDCLAHVTIPQDVHVVDEPAHLTVRDAIHIAQNHLPGADTVLLPYDLVVAFHCSTCQTHQSVLRPKEHVRHEEAFCPTCGQLREPAFTTSIHQDSPLAGLRLADLGIPKRDILAFTRGSLQTFLQFGA